jgi:hypothetical protein
MQISARVESRRNHITSPSLAHANLSALRTFFGLHMRSAAKGWAATASLLVEAGIYAREAMAKDCNCSNYMFRLGK